MTREPVTSSNIASIGYDTNTKTLEIEFKHSGVYLYHNVPIAVHKEFMGAESKGKYFAQNIKNGYKKI